MTTNNQKCKPWCDFNPKNLPNEKIGLCENPDHKDWTGDENIEQNLHLCMLYSDFFIQTMETDTSKLSEDERDRLWDEALDKKWKPDTEVYYCENCMECWE